jgi:hypothetical protein
MLYPLTVPDPPTGDGAFQVSVALWGVPEGIPCARALSKSRNVAASKSAHAIRQYFEYELCISDVPFLKCGAGVSSTDFHPWLFIFFSIFDNGRAAETPQTEEAAEKLQICHPEGRFCPRDLFFPCNCEKADPSLRSG